MRRILGTIGAVAVVAAAGFGGAGLGDEAQVHRGTIDAVQAQSASAELEVSDDGATLVTSTFPRRSTLEILMRSARF